MEYRKLGRTGLDCGEIAFGTWQIGGKRWRASADKSIELLRFAASKGVNLFDAAVVYGQYRDNRSRPHGGSLELLAEALKGLPRESRIYCVKYGQIDEISHRSAYSVDRIVSDFKESLAVLGVSQIDVALIHAPSIREIEDEKAITVLRTLQECEMVRAIGYSIENQPEHANIALDQKIDVLMLQYNLIDTECEDSFKKAEEHGVGILVGGPFKRGYLTGKYRSISDLPTDDDYFAWNVAHCRQKVEKTLSDVAELTAIHSKPTDLRKAGLNHILTNSSASCAVVGFRDVSEVCENISYSVPTALRHE